MTFIGIAIIIVGIFWIIYEWIDKYPRDIETVSFAYSYIKREKRRIIRNLILESLFIIFITGLAAMAFFGSQ